MLRRLGKLEDTELSDKFVENHDLVLFDAAELGAHHAIEHLIEVDEAVVYLNAHLENHTLYVHLAGILL